MVEAELEVIVLPARYGCPICESPYDFKEDAVKCLERGIIGEGPKIESGLVVKELYTDYWKNVYSVFVREFTVGHYRKNQFIHFKKRSKGIFKKINYLEHLFYPRVDEYHKRNFINSIKDRIELLPEDEFVKFRDEWMLSINKNAFTEEVINALDNLYNYHEWFDREKSQA